MLTYSTGAALASWLRREVTAVVFDRVAAAVSVFVVIWLFRLAPSDRGLVLPLGLILGGGMGNLIDRVLLGCRRFYFSALSKLVLAGLQSGRFGDYGGFAWWLC